MINVFFEGGGFFLVTKFMWGQVSLFYSRFSNRFHSSFVLLPFSLNVTDTKYGCKEIQC